MRATLEWPRRGLHVQGYQHADGACAHGHAIAARAHGRMHTVTNTHVHAADMQYAHLVKAQATHDAGPGCITEGLGQAVQRHGALGAAKLEHPYLAHLRVCAGICACVCARAFACMHVCVCARACARSHMYVCVRAPMQEYVRARVCARVCVHVRACTGSAPHVCIQVRA